MKLTLSGIEQAGAVDEYQETYDTLMKPYPDRPSATLPGVDLIVIDEETGLTMDSRSMQDVSPLNGIIDYREGAIAFNPLVQWNLPNGQPAAAEPIAGKRIRIYYRTRQNWGLQLTKAASTYYRQPDIRSLGYREYTIGSNGYLFFPIQDHDQSVLVDYTWRQNTSNGEVIRTETGEYHQILDPTLANSPQNQFANQAGNPNWWNSGRRLARGDAIPGSVNITRVRGVSVRARALWREGARWRKLDLELVRWPGSRHVVIPIVSLTRETRRHRSPNSVRSDDGVRENSSGPKRERKRSFDEEAREPGPDRAGELFSRFPGFLVGTPERGNSALLTPLFAPFRLPWSDLRVSASPW